MKTEILFADKHGPKVHFIDSDLLEAANPITLNLIGAGGTGSKVLTALVELNHSLIEFEHPGMQVRLWDDNIVTHANEGRQRFAECEEGLYKSVALINRANRWAGTNWKAETKKFENGSFDRLPEHTRSSIYVSCVDSVKARFEIAGILNSLDNSKGYSDRPFYWLDFGNSKYTGQAILSTIGDIKQPRSQKYETVKNLPFVTEEFGDLLKHSEEADDTPSYSLAEALERQDLFINGSLAQMGCSLLLSLFRNGFTTYKGFFHHIRDFRTHPIPVG
jgi:PRTRC genetic system ThiF family protein